MSVLDEAQSAEGGAATLVAGLRTLSLNQTVVFRQYVRKVLPLDGYVFWLGTKSAEIAGSLHVGADKRQLEDEYASINRVVFTTTEEVDSFNEIDPNTIWVGTWGQIKFAFAQRGPYYKTAKLFHYTGDSINPAMLSQLVDVGQQLSDATLIVSNSLPSWLQLVDYAPIWLAPPNPGIVLYPSFLVPANLAPPYGSVHIEPGETRALQAIPLADQNWNTSQLARDLVRITLYGLTNQQVQNFLNLVYQFSADTNAIGIMGDAVVRDAKRTQEELGVIAMKKLIEFEVSYNQGTQNNIARALLLAAQETFLPQPYGVP